MGLDVLRFWPHIPQLESSGLGNRWLQHLSTEPLQSIWILSIDHIGWKSKAYKHLQDGKIRGSLFEAAGFSISDESANFAVCFMQVQRLPRFKTPRNWVYATCGFPNMWKASLSPKPVVFYFSPHLCVGFLFLVVHPRPLLLPPPASTFSRSRTTYSHTNHTQLSHTQEELTHNTTYSHTTLSHTTHSHTTHSHTTYSHTTLTHNSLIRNLFTHNSLTQNSLTHNSLTHNFLTHTTRSHTAYPHTTCSQTTYWQVWHLAT